MRNNLVNKQNKEMKNRPVLQVWVARKWARCMEVMMAGRTNGSNGKEVRSDGEVEDVMSEWKKRK